jgi:hypothetical protein
MKLRSATRAPQVYIDRDAYQDMLAVSLATNDEVAWFSEVEQQGDTFLILTVYVPHQQSNAGTVEVEPEHLADFAEEFIDEHGIEAFNRLHCWGHSHHKMGVSPSHQDSVTVDRLCQSLGAPFLAVRINHRGEIQVDVAYPTGFTFEDADCYIGVPDRKREEEWAAIVKARVQRITYKAPKHPKVTTPGVWTAPTHWNPSGYQPPVGGFGPMSHDDFGAFIESTKRNADDDDDEIEVEALAWEAQVAEQITGVKRLPHESAAAYIERAERLDGEVYPSD